MTAETSLKRTPLFDKHCEAGGKLVEFAGWAMPVQYSGVIEEHRAVRSAAGLFDVSHMGEFRVSGGEAEAFLQYMTPNDVSQLTPGRAHYSALLSEQGTYIDDLLVYRLAPDDFLLVVNAANAEKDWAWMKTHLPPGVGLEDVSERYSLLALQGPRAVEILAAVVEVDVRQIRYYRFVTGELEGHTALISRTGYTGEDGFELYLAPESAPAVWDRVLEAGAGSGLVPAGLGARDTLRLEAAMALYGHEIDDTTTPFEAGLEWVVKINKGEFIGRQALMAPRARGPQRRLVGFEVVGRGIARQGHAIFSGRESVGRVTSGTWSPTFDKALGMGLVSADKAEIGTELEIQVRNRRLAATVVSLPFYKRSVSVR